MKAPVTPVGDVTVAVACEIVLVKVFVAVMPYKTVVTKAVVLAT